MGEHQKEKCKIGSLIRIKIRMQLSRHEVICEGDYGIIIDKDHEANPVRFDYLVVVNGIECFVFKDEIELVM